MMHLLPREVSADVAHRQASRYREMTAAEKLACADALWDLAWDATRTGIRMRNPGFDEAEVTRAARIVFDDASD